MQLRFWRIGIDEAAKKLTRTLLDNDLEDINWDRDIPKYVIICAAVKGLIEMYGTVGVGKERKISQSELSNLHTPFWHNGPNRLDYRKIMSNTEFHKVSVNRWRLGKVIKHRVELLNYIEEEYETHKKNKRR